MLRTAFCFVLVLHVLLATVECVNRFASDDARTDVESVTHVRAMDYVDRTTRSLREAETATGTLHDEQEEHEERTPRVVRSLAEGGPVLTKAAEVNAEVVAKVESLVKDTGLVDGATINKVKTAVSGDDGFVNAVASDERVKRLMADGPTSEVSTKAEGVATSKDPVDETKADSPNESEKHAVSESDEYEAKLKLIKAINAQTHKDSRRELKDFLVTHVILIAIIVGIAAIAAAYGQRREALAEANMYA